ncbi:MAG: SLBB domain-containing protein [Acidobacteria bacterium]|nr:SLBB domain-containing protein [Acidobacteriota bacterium]
MHSRILRISLLLLLPLWAEGSLTKEISAQDAAPAPVAPQGPATSLGTTSPSVISPTSPQSSAASLQPSTPSSEDEKQEGQTAKPPAATGVGTEIPPAPPTDFQLLVQASTGTLLPIFGADLFRNVPSTFAPVDNVPVTPQYVIGPGDEVVLQVWGQVRFRGRYVVDRSGNIAIPDVGSIHVAGLPYEKLQGYLQSELQRVYRNFDMTVNLGQLRSIQIFMVGNVVRPGSFTVSSLSTLVNALFASGGPSSTGSLRHILLKRSGEVVRDFDLYDLLLKGDKSADAPLLPGDVIYVPPVGPQVAVAGSVLNPAIYELRGETTVQQVMTLAGGPTVTASEGSVRIERIENHKERSVLTVNYGKEAEAPVHSGDILIFSKILDRFRNAVTLRGNVQNPGRYVWHPGMRISDLIPEKDALLTKDYYRTHNLLGIVSGTDYQQPQEGNLSVSTKSTKSEESETGNQKASAAITSAPPADGFQPKNDVLLSAADINWNYAVIERLNTNDLTTSLIPFNLGEAILDRNPAANLELQPGDIVTIFSKADIAVPQSQRSRYVRLEGEFIASGVYSVLPGETLRSLVHRAGGLTSDAYLFGAEFRRESTRKLQQQRIKEYADEMESQLLQSQVATQTAGNVQNIVFSPAALQRLRTLRATGRIVLGLTPWSAGEGEIPDIPLEDGDRFVVPRRPSTVAVMGSVYNSSSFLYRTHTNVSTYLHLAGGSTRQGDEKRAFIIRADGSVVSHQFYSGWHGKSFGSVAIYPGDTIVMPPKISVRDPFRVMLDIAQIVGQFGLGAAAVNVLK